MKHIAQVDIIKSVRKTWDFPPTTRTVPSKKLYKRKNKFNKLD